MSLHVVDSIFKVKYVNIIHSIDPTDPSCWEPTISRMADPINGLKKTPFLPSFFTMQSSSGFFRIPRSLGSCLDREVLECFSQAPFSTDPWGRDAYLKRPLEGNAWKSHMVFCVRRLENNKNPHGFLFKVLLFLRIELCSKNTWQWINGIRLYHECLICIFLNWCRLIYQSHRSVTRVFLLRLKALSYPGPLSIWFLFTYTLGRLGWKCR